MCLRNFSQRLQAKKKRTEISIASGRFREIERLALDNTMLMR